MAALTQGVINLDFFAMAIALPDMAQSLDTTVTDLQWVISGYMIALAAFFIPGGRLGDIFGRKRLLLVGMALFATSALLAGLAGSAGLVIIMRVSQGLGAAIAYPLAIAVVNAAYPADRVARAVGIVFGTSVIGTAIGPFVGGVLTQLFSWRLVFLINVPLCLIVIALAWRFIEDSRDESVPRVIDFRGLALVAGGVSLVTLAGDRGPVWGWTSVLTLGTFVLGLALLTGFALVELRVRYPLLDVRLFKGRVFDVLIGAGAVGNMVFTAVMLLMTMFLQQVRGLTPIAAGLVFLAAAVGDGVAGQLSGRVGHFPPWAVMTVALAVGAVGVAGLAVAQSWWVIGVAFTTAGFGMGLSWAFASVGVQTVVPKEKSGAAAGAVLTVLVGMGGLMVAGAATAVEGLQAGGRDLDGAIQVVFWALAGLAAVSALLTAVLGRTRAAADPAPAAVTVHVGRHHVALAGAGD